MRKIQILFVIFLVVTLQGFAKSKVFEEAIGLKGVETVTIGKAAMQMVKKSIYTGDNYVPKDAIRDVEGMEIITAGSQEAIDAVKPILQRVLQSGRYEPLIESKGDDSSSAIYTILPDEGTGDDGVCKNILIVSEEPWELGIVLIKGTFNMDKIVTGNMNRAVPR